MAFGPFRNPDEDSERTLLFGIDLYGDFALPWVFSLLGYGDSFPERNVRLAVDEQVEVYALIGDGIDVAWNTCIVAENISRTAGAAGPAALIGRRAVDVVAVEHSLPVEGHCREEGVVDDFFELIHVGGIRVKTVQAMGPHRIGYGAATLSVTIFRSDVVGFAVPLVSGVDDPGSSGNVHVPFGHVLPDRIYGGPVAFIAGRSDYVSCPNIEVGSPYAVSRNMPLFDERKVILCILSIRVPCGVVTAFVDEEAGQIEKPLVACCFVVAGEGAFDLLMSRDVVPLVRPEDREDLIRSTQGRFENFRFTGGFGVGEGRFEQVSDTVEFM